VCKSSTPADQHAAAIYLDNEYYATPKYINHTIYIYTFLNRSVSIIFLALRASKYISGLEGPV
jgi:hypothetical protein